MMCRVTAPLTALFRREAASRSPFRPPTLGPSALHRRLRIARHRALRWFHEPIACSERERRDRDLVPSVWRYDFRPWPTLSFAEIERARRAAIRRLV
jgi:hypothetical protein